MSGTPEGSKKAVAKLLAKDPDHFKKMGSRGGKVSKRHLSHEEAVRLGKMGGHNGKRGKAKKKYTVTAQLGEPALWSGMVIEEMETSYAIPSRQQPKKRTLIDKLLRRRK